MTDWRELKRNMRRDVHQTMSVPVLYLASPTADPVRVNVRDHTKWGAAVPRGEEGLATIQDVTPRFKFMRSEVPSPNRQGIVVVSETEMHTLGASRPPDDEWITVEAAPYPPDKTAALWKPEWADLLL